MPDKTHPLETYLRELRDIHNSGAGVAETSYYGPLASLLNAAGIALKPRVLAIINIGNRGAGIPDGGFFTADQFERGADAEWQSGQIPSRGVFEAKSTAEDVQKIADSDQV